MSSAGLRVAIIGYGAMAEVHVNALREAGASPQLAVGPSLNGVQGFAAAHSIPSSTTNVEDAWLAESIDAVVVASPNAMHESQALAAMAAGKHVLCEVPLALSAGGAERLASQSTRRAFMVAHTQRYWGPALELRRRIAEGIVTPVHASVRYLLRRRDNVGWTGRARSWTDSALWHHGAHAVDTALWLLGSPVLRVTAVAGQTASAPDRPMDISIGVRVESGGLASITLSYNSKRAVTDVILIAEEETFEISNAALMDSAGKRLVVDPDVQEMQWRAVCLQDEAFVRAAVSGRSSAPTPQDVLPAYRALGAIEDQIAKDIYKSSEKG